jgi:hypothetical protein
MHNADTPSRSVVAVAETEKSKNGTGTDERPSTRILLAREILGDLLLKDEFAFSGSLLVGPVAEKLNEMMISLDEAAGLQKLFECWVGPDGPTT